MSYLFSFVLTLGLLSLCCCMNTLEGPKEDDTNLTIRQKKEKLSACTKISNKRLEKDKVFCEKIEDLVFKNREKDPHNKEIEESKESKTNTKHKDKKQIIILMTTTCFSLISHKEAIEFLKDDKKINPLSKRCKELVDLEKWEIFYKEEDQDKIKYQWNLLKYTLDLIIKEKLGSPITKDDEKKSEQEETVVSPMKKTSMSIQDIQEEYESLDKYENKIFGVDFKRLGDLPRTLLFLVFGFLIVYIIRQAYSIVLALNQNSQLKNE